MLLAQGTPVELGEQVGTLALKPALDLTKLADRFIKENGWERLYPVLLKTGSLLLPQFPPDHRIELEAAAKTSGWPKDLLIFANTVPDLRKLTGCSALLVESAHAGTGGPLFRRKWTAPRSAPFPSTHWSRSIEPRGSGIRFGSGIQECSDARPESTMPGLALAELTVTTAADDSPTLNLAGVPFTLGSAVCWKSAEPSRKPRNYSGLSNGPCGKTWPSATSGERRCFRSPQRR